MPTAPDPGSPPKATHAVLSDPAPPRLRRAVFKLFTAVHVEPFQLSVPAKYSGDPPLSLNPPNANAEVVIPPAPPSFLAVFKSATSVQFVPFQLSVSAVTGGLPPLPAAPPIQRAAVLVPVPAAKLLARFKLLTFVQLVPFHFSVALEAALGDGAARLPAKANAAVPKAPAPAKALLDVFKSCLFLTS